MAHADDGTVGGVLSGTEAGSDEVGAASEDELEEVDEEEGSWVESEEVTGGAGAGEDGALVVADVGSLLEELGGATPDDSFDASPVVVEVEDGSAGSGVEPAPGWVVVPGTVPGTIAGTDPAGEAVPARDWLAELVAGQPAQGGAFLVCISWIPVSAAA